MANSKSWGYIVVLLLMVAGFIFFRNKKETHPGDLIQADTAIVSIDKLTSEEVVVPYVKKHQKLPDYYITKNEARKGGWIASEGNLCEVLPGKAIGGDVFSNREGNLPSSDNRKWYEADLNYKCGRRNAHRLLYSNDGLIYVTHDHYKTFERQ
ncbi:MAG: ribonuclease domain-containing protein [Niabella sp.]